MNELELCYRSAIDLAEDIAKKRLSPLEIVDTFLARIERLNPTLNAYCTLTADQARADARRAESVVMRGDALGPLHGVPVSIKDVIITKDVRTTRGSKLYDGFVPDEDAPLVERLKSAGAIVLGKTNTPEFGWKGVTDNRVFGPSRNPWNIERTPGGSSGGASAQVAAGLGPVAIGTDGGGSIRIPAAFAGCFGFKPSFGRVPMYPASAPETLSHAGPITNTVRDAGLTMKVIAGPDHRDRGSLPDSGLDYLSACAINPSERQPLRGLRVGWSPDLGHAPVEPDVRETAEAAARRFGELGCVVEAVNPGWADPGETWNYFFYDPIVASFGDRLAEVRDMLDPGLLEVAENRLPGRTLEYLKAQFARNAFWDQVRQFYESYDLLLTPTMPLAAFEIMRNTPGQIAGRSVEGLGWSPFTFPFNLTGQPAASLPCGFTQEGLPIGLQVVGRWRADETVLRASAAFESIAPWQSHRPAL